MKITVFGLGYVGCVTAALLARDGHTVAGVDISQFKVDQITSGKSPVLEPGLDAVVKEAVAQGNLTATCLVEEGLCDSDVSLVCVGTPSARDGSLDLQYVREVAKQIGENISVANADHTVVIRSTVLPGSTRREVIPVLEQATGRKAGDGYDVCTNPEFLREGTSLTDYYEPPRILVGERVPGVGQKVHDLYSKIQGAPAYSVPLEVAEAVKYTDNAFHALKVTFANEIGRVWECAGADPIEVMKIVSEDVKLNISPVYLRPGFAFGGSCLPKDLRALCYAAKSNDVLVPMLENIDSSNREHIDRAFRAANVTGRRNVAMIGLAFKSNTDDLRESPYLKLAKQLIGEGYELKIFDPVVHSAKLLGSNKHFMLTEIPHISKLLDHDIEAVTSTADLVLIGHSLPDPKLITQWEASGKIVIDLNAYI